MCIYDTYRYQQGQLNLSGEVDEPLVFSHNTHTPTHLHRLITGNETRREIISVLFTGTIIFFSDVLSSQLLLIFLL